MKIIKKVFRNNDINWNIVGKSRFLNSMEACIELWIISIIFIIIGVSLMPEAKKCHKKHSRTFTLLTVKQVIKGEDNNNSDDTDPFNYYFIGLTQNNEKVTIKIQKYNAFTLVDGKKYTFQLEDPYYYRILQKSGYSVNYDFTTSNCIIVYIILGVILMIPLIIDIVSDCEYIKNYREALTTFISNLISFILLITVVSTITLLCSI